MKRIMLICGVIALFTACNSNSTSTSTSETKSVVSEIKDAVTGEGLKSASYESETDMPGGMGKTNMKVTFDDFGKKSKTETTTAMSFGGKSMNNTMTSLMVDDFVYSWAAGAKTGTKFKVDRSKVDPKNMDFSKMTDDMRKKMNYKDEGTETVNGKECKVASYDMEQMKGKMWMWKQIPMKMEMTMAGQVITTNIKNVEENPAIDASTFAVPTDVEFKEMTMPATAGK